MKKLLLVPLLFCGITQGSDYGEAVATYYSAPSGVQTNFNIYCHAFIQSYRQPVYRMSEEEKQYRELQKNGDRTALCEEKMRIEKEMEDYGWFSFTRWKLRKQRNLLEAIIKDPITTYLASIKTAPLGEAFRRLDCLRKMQPGYYPIGVFATAMFLLSNGRRILERRPDYQAYVNQFYYRDVPIMPVLAADTFTDNISQAEATDMVLTTVSPCDHLEQRVLDALENPELQSMDWDTRLTAIANIVDELGTQEQCDKPQRIAMYLMAVVRFANRVNTNLNLTGVLEELIQIARVICDCTFGQFYLSTDEQMHYFAKLIELADFVDELYTEDEAEFIACVAESMGDIVTAFWSGKIGPLKARDLKRANAVSKTLHRWA